MIADGVACLLMLGSDITVRRSLDATVGDGADHVSLRILTAGAASLVANSLHIPVDLEAAVDVRATIRKARMAPVEVNVEPEGREWFSGEATCVLVDNVDTVLGGVNAFADASPIPGRIDVATAEKFKIELKSKMPWGDEGGDRTPTEIFEVRCHSGAARVCPLSGAA